ncbi:hypothetical protein BOX15_Mlig018220g1 [Macrostomum lignano]|uniref:RING-type domain-containing protein n=1 Tax=Macrostomum lignano TaxID=282301 RepID=A0A267EW25_9PLAT|nr:hypothetical protein BOX15_Mlig018220g1 [Macrostomum lignano]
MDHRRRSTGHSSLPVPVHRRGSIEQSYGSPQSVDVSKMICPKCNQFFTTPIILPSCNHRVCKRCIKHLFGRSNDGYIHCPMEQCNKLSATAPESLRTDTVLRTKVRDYLRDHPDSRRRDMQRRNCERSNCNAVAVGREPCPHCLKHLCQQHFDADCEIVNQNCLHWQDMAEQTLSQGLDLLDNYKLQKRSIRSHIEDNNRAKERLIRSIEKTFADMQAELSNSEDNVNAAERKLRDFYDRVTQLQEDLTNGLEVDEDDHATLKKKQKLVTDASKMLERGIDSPRLPNDVRFNHSSADIGVIEQKIGELRVLQNSLEADVTRKQTVNCSEGELKVGTKDLQQRLKAVTPHHAVLWSHTKDFCLSRENIVKRRSCDNFTALPDEVLIVSDLIKLHVLSMDGAWLGQIKVTDDGTTPYSTRYLTISPDGRQLALLLHDKVLLCDMDGTKQIEVQPDFNIRTKFHGFCSVALSEKYLMLVAPGNTTHKRPGAIFILEAPQFDFSRAQRIPLDHRRIFPTGVTHVRGSFLVLANRLQVEEEPESASNELLMYDARTHKFVAEMPISDGLQSALYIFSDDSGRVFVSLGCCTRRDDRRPRSSCAKVDVLDPQGHRIGAIGGSDRDFTTCNGISVSDARSAAGRPTRLVACDATRRLVHVYTLGCALS